MDGRSLCKQIALLHDGIHAAGIIEDGELSEFYFKPKVPMQSSEKLGEMAMHATIVAVIGVSGEDFYGSFRYVMFHWENADAFIFPIVLPDEGSDKATPMLLGVQVARPYPHDELVELISGLLRRNRIAPAASAPRYADRKK